MEVSIDTSWKFPSVRSFAKLLSWLTVLFNSALHLASGSPVSEQYTFTISSVINSSSSEIWFKNFDLSNDDTCLNILNASLASLVDFSISISLASKNVMLFLGQPNNTKKYYLNLFYLHLFKYILDKQYLYFEFATNLLSNLHEIYVNILGL